MKKITLIVILISWLPLRINGQSAPYSRVLFNATPEQMKAMAEQGVALDHLGETDKGLIGEFSSEETAIVKTYSTSFSILVADVSKHFLENNIQPSAKRGLTYPTPAAFKLGSMGGYLTVAQADSHINAMIKNYPTIISKKDTIGTSLQGRVIYAFKVSDNPNIDENEPEVLYTALHHAREPMSLMQMIYYLYYVLENYGKSGEITNIVNNSEMYFVPFINPDGYYYNESTNPKGGGMWRKNMRKTSDSTFGIDLNRNYGYQWGYNNTGSSPSMQSETYRGPSAFSEPETQVMRDYCIKRHFKATLNYHAYGNYLIYPWGNDLAGTSCIDSTEYKDFAELLTEENFYTAGTCMQTLKYTVNGNSDDWMYGEQTDKNKIYAFTPEVGSGSYGFWPPINEIVPYCDINIRQNINLALIGMGLQPNTGLTSVDNYEPRLFPNPSTGIISIIAAAEFNLVISDFTGRCVFNGKTNGQEIDLSLLGNGIYYCHISLLDGIIFTRQLVILR